MGDEAAKLLTREQWAGDLRLELPGDHPERPAIKKHKGVYPGASSSPGLFVCATEHHIWRKWGAMGNAHEWGIHVAEGRLARPTWADYNIMFATITTMMDYMWSAAKALISATHYAIMDNGEDKRCVYNTVGRT